MDDYFAARGRASETLFGFRREGTLALFRPAWFHEDVRLDASEDGVVRCRLGGAPSALVPVTDRLHLDVSSLVVAWPRLVIELVERTGEEAARALLAEPAILETDEPGRLEAMILEHEIRAERLHLLGERAPSSALGTLEGEPRFELRFERGTLELAYTREAFVEAQALGDAAFGAPELDVDVRWNGAPIALPGAELAWREAELAEVAAFASMVIEGRPEVVVSSFDAVFPTGVDELESDATLGTILNFWGVALRRIGRLDVAVRTLTRALAIAERTEPKLEQQVAYNLGYAKLQTTMKERYRVGASAGIGLYTAHYDIDERHRDTWTECLALFERALALDPSDVTAQAQVAQSRQLLALLDGNARSAAPRRGNARSAARPSEPRRAAPANGLVGWLVLGAVVLILVAFAVVMKDEHARTPLEEVPPAREPSAREPSAREISDAARVAALDRFDLAALPMATDAPCPIAIDPPREVPRGDVVAPHLSRAIGTGELYGTDYFDATIRQYAARFAPNVEVRPASREGIGPLTGARGEGPSMPWLGAYELTMLVTAWRDPIVIEGGASMVPGRVEARLVVWSYESSRFVCTGEVEAESSAGQSIARAPANDWIASEDDPLNRARLDLVEQALRLGIPRLAATEASAD